MRLRTTGAWTPEVDASHAAWLAAVGNAFVNAIRPRIQRLLGQVRGVQTMPCRHLKQARGQRGRRAAASPATRNA